MESRSALWLVVASALLTGCLDENLELGSNQLLSYETYRALVQEDPETGGFVLDWDVVVYSEDAIYQSWSRSQPGALLLDTQNGIDVKWSAAEQHALSYCVSTEFAERYTEVVAAMREATTNGWQLFGDVAFPYHPEFDAACTAGTSAVKFTVRPTADGAYLAHSFFPNEVAAKRVLHIDDSAFDRPDLALPNILTHELGHILGFRHEHIARPGQTTPGCVEDRNYRVVGDGYDKLSTMHYPQCGEESDTLALSSQDKIDVTKVYGRAAGGANLPPMTKVNWPQEHSSLAQAFTVNAAAVDDDLVRVELHIDGRWIATKTSGPFTFDVPPQPFGAHVVELLATDSEGLTTTKQVAVSVDRTGTDVGRPAVGGCATGGAGGAGGAGLVGLLAIGMRRRRRPPGRATRRPAPAA